MIGTLTLNSFPAYDMRCYLGLHCLQLQPQLHDIQLHHSLLIFQEGTMHVFLLLLGL